MAIKDDTVDIQTANGEFEALKNNFVSQIENYNDSIDGKIDGAIASYLAGVNISKKQIKSLLIKDWDKYVMMNKSIPNDYVYPDFSGQYSLFKYATIADEPFDTSSWNKSVSLLIISKIVLSA